MRFGRLLKLSMLATAIKEIARQNWWSISLLISTGEFLFQQTQTAKALRLKDPFCIHQGHIERLAAGFLSGQPRQLVVPYLQMPGFLYPQPRTGGGQRQPQPQRQQRRRSLRRRERLQPPMPLAKQSPRRRPNPSPSQRRQPPRPSPKRPRQNRRPPTFPLIAAMG